MKYKTLYPLLLALIIMALSGCDKDIGTTGVYIPFNGPLVKTKTVIANGSTTTTTYTYDNIGRIATSAQTFSSNTYTYTQQSVTQKNYSLNSNTDTAIFTYIYTLNREGLATNIGTDILYTYDDERHMTEENYVFLYSRSNYTYSNGNIAEEIRNGRTYTYHYFTDKQNTIGNQNMGKGWMGTSSVNLVSSIDYKVNGTLTTDTYAYEYDNQNRVTRVTVTKQGAQEQTEYTYY